MKNIPPEDKKILLKIAAKCEKLLEQGRTNQVLGYLGLIKLLIECGHIPSVVKEAKALGIDISREQCPVIPIEDKKCRHPIDCIKYINGTARCYCCNSFVKKSEITVMLPKYPFTFKTFKVG